MAIVAFDYHTAMIICVQLPWAQGVWPQVRKQGCSSTFGGSAGAVAKCVHQNPGLLWTPIGEVLGQQADGGPFLTLSPWQGVCNGVCVQPLVLPEFMFVLMQKGKGGRGAVRGR